MFWRKIGTKLNIVFLAVLVLAIFGTNYFSCRSAKKILQGKILDCLSLIADLGAGDLNSFLGAAEDRVSDFSSDGFIRDTLVQIEAGKAGAVDALSMHLTKNKLSIDPNLFGIAIVDNGGKVVASTIPIKIGTNHADHEHFKIANKLLYGEAYISDIFFDANINPNTAFFTAVAPLFDRDGKNMIGVIENLIDIRKLSDVIVSDRASIAGSGKKIEEGKSFETLITNKDGLSLVELKYAPGSFLKRQTATLPIKNCAKGIRTAEIYDDYRGVSVVGAAVCLKHGWVMEVKLDADEVIVIDKTVRNFIIIVFLVAIAVLYILIYLFIGTLIKPIDELRHVAEKFGAGDFSQRVKFKTSDEFGEFSRVFNEMADSLEGSHKNLEAKVIEKTASLNEKVTELIEAQKALINVVEDLNIEKELLNTEKAKDEALLESMGDGVIAIDREKRIIYTNPAADTMFGWKGADVIGKLYHRVWEVVDERGDAVLHAKRPMEAAFGGKKSINRNIYYRSIENDRKNPVSSTVAPIILNGETIGVINVIKDITQEIEIDKAKTEFVSIASHQLRTPLTAIKWYAEMLLDKGAGKLSKKQKDYLNEIYAGNQRMISLVGALLNVSRIDLGTFAVEPQLTDIKKLADDILGEMKMDVKKKSLRIVREYEPIMPKVNADIKLVRIIIQNLLSNAIKYTPPKGKISLSILKDKNNVLIKVRDTGYGIPKDAQKKIFTKLFRADNVKVKEPEGTGLGLYIVKAIVDQSGGKIWFESEENKGTTFYVSLPLAGMKKKQGTKELINE